MNCPNCNAILPKNAQEGEEIICLSCSKKVSMHYTLKEQLKDPLGILFRNPKYVRKQFKWVFIIVVIVAVILAVIQVLSQSQP